MPRDNAYGVGWPVSGEIDIVESRGNKNFTINNFNIGTHQVTSTLHWGPISSQNRYPNTTWSKSSEDAGFDEEFHIYELLWTPTNVTFSVDGEVLGIVAPLVGGFWEMGGFANSHLDNPWIGGTRMAPFDQEFYLIINLAVGGVGYFPDDADNGNGRKPWSNKSKMVNLLFVNVLVYCLCLSRRLRIFGTDVRLGCPLGNWMKAIRQLCKLITSEYTPFRTVNGKKQKLWCFLLLLTLQNWQRCFFVSS